MENVRSNTVLIRQYNNYENIAMPADVFIETNRLILRTVTMDDLEDVAVSWKLDDGPISPAEAEATISRMLNNHRQNVSGKVVHLCLAIIDKETQAFIGWCGLDHLDQTKPNPMLFYLLKASHWGKGLATEAASGLLTYAFGNLRLRAIDSATAFDNMASKRVMEKIGMRYLGINEAGGYSFTLTREEYV